MIERLLNCQLHITAFILSDTTKDTYLSRAIKNQTYSELEGLYGAVIIPAGQYTPIT